MQTNTRIGDLEPKADALGLSPAALVVGGTLAAISVSGLLDDSGTLRHPWWSVPAGALVIASLGIAGRTLRLLRTVPEPSDTPETLP